MPLSLYSPLSHFYIFRCIGCPQELHEYKGAVICHEKWPRRSAAKPNEAIRAPPPLETIADARKRVDNWDSGVPGKIAGWSNEVKEAREKLEKGKSYRKARMEGTEEGIELAKQQQKVWHC